LSPTNNQTDDEQVPGWTDNAGWNNTCHQAGEWLTVFLRFNKNMIPLPILMPSLTPPSHPHYLIGLTVEPEQLGILLQ
jgi:hypothetical protein